MLCMCGHVSADVFRCDVLFLQRKHSAMVFVTLFNASALSEFFLTGSKFSCFYFYNQTWTCANTLCAMSSRSSLGLMDKYAHLV